MNNVMDSLSYTMHLLVATAAAIFLLILSTLLFLYRSGSVPFEFKKTSTHQRIILQIKDILHPNITIEDHLEERAQANQRLVRALHISNTFVSADPSVHKTFVAHAQHLLKAAQRRGWPHFRAIAIDAVQWQLSPPEHDQYSEPSQFEAEQKSFKFDSFVQNITLIVVLVGILQLDKPIQSFSHYDVALVASRITTLWALSKKPDPIPPVLLQELTTHLRRLVSLDEEAQFPVENPLDFVIPAWETLWRVVATTVAYAYHDGEMRRAFEEFNGRLSDDSFRRREERDQTSESDVDTSVSVKGIVSEAMRLHPPSKHIGRSKRRWAWCPRLLADWIGKGIMRVRRQADIEKILRCEIWGLDANEFRPSRHDPRHILPDQKQALAFIFGDGPLRCIAHSWAPMAAGVIAGVVIDQLDIRGCELDTGPTIGGREGWNGWLIKRTE